MNPFETLRYVQDQYKTYVYTFQKIKNPHIQRWIFDRINDGSLLWRPPHVQLNQRFAPGRTLQEMVTDGLLHPDVLKIFTRRDASGKLTTNPIKPHKHQSESVKAILADKANTVITTGTSSGKSFCFGIPIVNECLKMKKAGVKGIKAIIVYPMNALANSQYEDFSERLNKSGLTVALYTGDTTAGREEALENLKASTSRILPYDSEVLSREDIQNNPPDILMTNYVMLDLLLTRFGDRNLFPEEGVSPLKFLVLDEVHTYNGKKGADVAALIRRLKERTRTRDSIRCIATSATIEKTGDEDANQVIATFAQDLFGESFNRANIVSETYLPISLPEPDPLPTNIGVTLQHLEGFDGSPEKIQALVSTLIGKSVDVAKTTPEDLGSILMKNRTIQYLISKLSDHSVSVTDLVDDYQKTLRPTQDSDECRPEIYAALLAGTLGKILLNDEYQPIFVPKLHTFFSQGREISSCLSNPEDPHLNDRGDALCPTCAQERKQRTTFPLVFCRSCGQEFYGVTIKEDNTVVPRDMDSIDLEGTNVYFYTGRYNENQISIPDEWREKKKGTNQLGKAKSEYEPHIPALKNYCPVCNKIDSSCNHKEKIPVYRIGYPFIFCPNCGVRYTRAPREFNKLFTFGSIGRSTGTDILISSTIAKLKADEKKIIAFSDSRQDTALQASHINNLQKRIHFRQAWYWALIDSGFTEVKNRSVSFTQIGDEIFKAMNRYAQYGALPDYSKEVGRFIEDPIAQTAFINYLSYQALFDLAPPLAKNQQNLEDVGLIKIQYNGLDKLAAAADVWQSVPELRDMPVDLRFDYLLGYLDIFRKQRAVYHKYLIQRRDFQHDVLDHINESAQFDVSGAPKLIQGYGDESARGPKYLYRILRLTHRKSRLMTWTEKVLACDPVTASHIVVSVLEILKNPSYGRWLTEHQIRAYRGRGITGTIFLINSDRIMLQAVEREDHMLCGKCGAVYHFRKENRCLKSECGTLHMDNFGKNYFRQAYAKPFADASQVFAEEHSGQIEGKERKQIESRFRNNSDPLNVLVCTPTMELGIDIGDLTAVYMRNVPPSPSNYAQRAGRAGRKSQPSLITTFCGVGSSRGPHDQYFYRYPGKIISGKISAPRFMLDNQKLIRTHINAIILETLRERQFGDFKFPNGFGEILNINSPGYPIFPDFREAIETILTASKNAVFVRVKNTFCAEQQHYPWFTDEYLEEIIDTFLPSLEECLRYWRDEYSLIYREHQDLSAQGRNEGSAEHSRMQAIELKLKAMREGEREFYSYRYLATQGFLPNYGFPTSTSILSLDDQEKEIDRSSNIALSEFAPGNTIYYKGSKYLVTYAKPRRESTGLITETTLVCPNCSTFLRGQQATTLSACPRCGHPFTGLHPKKNSMQMMNMHAVKRTHITSDEEERLRKGYKLSVHYEPQKITEKVKILGKNSEILLEYEHNGRIIQLNSGTRKFEDDGQDHGFVLCESCNRWLFGEDTIAKHIGDSEGKCPKNAGDQNIRRDIILFTIGIHDVVTLRVPCPEDLSDADRDIFYTTLKESLMRGLQLTLNMTEDEIDGFVVVRQDTRERHIILYEMAEGGTGAVKSLFNPYRLKEIFQRIRELLHEFDKKPGCSSSCYECLLSFYNQREHGLLDRNHILPFLQSFETLSIENIRTEELNTQLTDLLSKCESSLEKKFLNILIENKKRLPDSAQEVLLDPETRSPIARPDFFYKSENLAIFIDGNPHDRDYVQKDDERKRSKLKEIGYRPVTIRYDSFDEDMKKFERILG